MVGFCIKGCAGLCKFAMNIFKNITVSNGLLTVRVTVYTNGTYERVRGVEARAEGMFYVCDMWGRRILRVYSRV